MQAGSAGSAFCLGVDAPWQIAPFVVTACTGIDDTTTVFTNSNQVISMDIDFDAEAWLGTPAPADMLRQQLSLVETENDLLRAEIERYRLNQAKLITMLRETTDERDMLRRDVSDQSRKLSEMYVERAQLKNGLSAHGG